VTDTAHGSNGGAPPRIDPTVLTTEVIDKAKEDLRREMETIVTGLRIEVMSEIRRVNDVADQKFNAIKQQFDERDTRTEQAAAEGRISLDAALAAAKEAVTEQNKSNALSIEKSEVATQKRIDANELLSRTSLAALSDRLDDVKERQDKGQAGVNGVALERTEHRLDRSGYTAFYAAAMLTIGIVVSTLIAVFHH
jgi:hypothetical protein